MRTYLRAAAVACVLAFGLAGCAHPSLNLNNTVTLNTLDGVVSAYGIALSAERAYKALPLCKTGTTISITNPCAKRSVIVRLQTADRTAISAISSADAFIKTYPTVDATNVISAASAAVQALRGILSTEGV